MNLDRSTFRNILNILVPPTKIRTFVRQHRKHIRIPENTKSLVWHDLLKACATIGIPNLDWLPPQACVPYSYEPPGWQCGFARGRLMPQKVGGDEIPRLMIEIKMQRELEKYLIPDLSAMCMQFVSK